jgi:hypothetical protein
MASITPLSKTNRSSTHEFMSVSSFFGSTKVDPSVDLPDARRHQGESVAAGPAQ